MSGTCDDPALRRCRFRINVCVIFVALGLGCLRARAGAEATSSLHICTLRGILQLTSVGVAFECGSTEKRTRFRWFLWWLSLDFPLLPDPHDPLSPASVPHPSLLITLLQGLPDIKNWIPRKLYKYSSVRYRGDGLHKNVLFEEIRNSSEQRFKCEKFVCIL